MREKVAIGLGIAYLLGIGFAVGRITATSRVAQCEIEDYADDWLRKHKLRGTVRCPWASGSRTCDVVVDGMPPFLLICGRDGCELAP